MNDHRIRAVVSTLMFASAICACGPGGIGEPGGPTGEWRNVPIVAPDGYNFMDVDGSGANDVWVVGRGAFRWNGTDFGEDARWSNTSLRAVEVVAANDVYVVPTASKDLHHFDGSAWTKASTVVDSSTLYDVFAAGPQVWARTFDKLYRLDGATLTHVPFNGKVGQAAGLGTDDVLISSDRKVYRWSGGQWSELFAAPWAVVELVPFGTSDVWVRMTEGSFASVGHWDGSTFTEYSLGDMGVTSVTQIAAMWGASGNDVWFARPYFEGEYVDPAPMSEFIHWNGSTFSSVQVEQSFEAASGWGTDSSNVWFVGGPGKVLRFSP